MDDGMRTPRGNKSVAFDVPGSVLSSQPPVHGESSGEDRHNHRRRRRQRQAHYDDDHEEDDDDDDRGYGSTRASDGHTSGDNSDGHYGNSSGRNNERYYSRRRQDQRRHDDYDDYNHNGRPSSTRPHKKSSAVENDSDDTEDLPARFDNEGRRVPERDDAVMEKIQDMLAGKGSAGNFLRRLTGDFLGGGQSEDENGRRRRK